MVDEAKSYKAVISVNTLRWNIAEVKNYLEKHTRYGIRIKVLNIEEMGNNNDM